MKIGSKIDITEFKSLIKDKDIALFIGNGFSINFDSRFRYKDLMQNIEKDWYPENLIKELLAIKGKLSKIKTFEDLWLDLQKTINKDFSCRLTIPILNLHQELLESADFSKKLKQYGEWLSQFDKIFTTNYDLSIHWMLTETKSIDKTHHDGISNKRGQNIFYLHGAVHLYYLYDNSGKKHGWEKPYRRVLNNNHQKQISAIKKAKAKSDKNAFFEVLGGTYQEKDFYINRSEYLSTCRTALMECAKTNLLIFGSSLHDNDKHLWDILNTHKTIKVLYISALGANHGVIKKTKKLFPNKKVEFFDPNHIFKMS